MLSILNIVGDDAIGLELMGTVTRWVKPKKFGFISIPESSETIFLTAKEWKGDNMFPCENESVSFVLGKNDKGWKAFNCHRVDSISTCTNHQSSQETVSPNIGTNFDNTVTLLSSSTFLCPSFSDELPKEYRPVVASVDYFSSVKIHDTSCADSRQFYQAMLKRSQTSMEELVSSKNIGLIYRTEMDRHVEDIDENIFADFPAPEHRVKQARMDWKSVRVLQRERDLTANRNKIMIEDLKRLDGFKMEIQKEEQTLARINRFSNDKSHLKTVNGILEVYNNFITNNSNMPWYWKAGWMFYQIYRQRSLVKEDILNACILSNWVLIQEGMPFPVDYDFTLMAHHEDMAQRVALSAESEGPYSSWILSIITNQWTDFECCCEELVQSSLQAMSLSSPPAIPAMKINGNVPQPVDTTLEQALNNHRRQLKNSEVCFICYDDSVKCTVSLLCCGQATHTRCMEQWNISSKVVPGNEECPKCRQRNPEPPIVRRCHDEDDDDDDDEDDYYSDDDNEEEMNVIFGNRWLPHTYFGAFPSIDDDENGYYDDDSSSYRPRQQNQSYCHACDQRLRANACSNGCCALCCADQALPCIRHGFV